MFSGGSNNLSVEVSDDNVLEATIDAGKIKIKTKKNGIVSVSYTHLRRWLPIVLLSYFFCCLNGL